MFSFTFYFELAIFDKISRNMFSIRLFLAICFRDVSCLQYATKGFPIIRKVPEDVGWLSTYPEIQYLIISWLQFDCELAIWFFISHFSREIGSSIYLILSVGIWHFRLLHTGDSQVSRAKLR